MKLQRQNEMRKAAYNRIAFTGLSLINETQPPLGRAVLSKHLGVQLLHGVYSNCLFTALGDQLVALAEQAYGLRQLDRVGELSQALLTLPLPDEYRSAARYFRGLELNRQGDLYSARSVFEGLASERTHRYTARAIQSLGQTFHAQGDFESALKLYIESNRRAQVNGRFDPVTTLFSQKNIAVLKSAQGDHRGALSDLERISSLARAVGSLYPQVYYDYQNSIAVELTELRRITEAAQASRIALSSPFAAAYPEWRETFAEITAIERQRASRSAVAVRECVGSKFRDADIKRDTGKLLRLPSAKVSDRAAPIDRQPLAGRARILNFQQLKPIVRASNHTLPQGVAPVQRNRMTIGEKLIRLMDLISHDETDDETIDKILDVVEQIVPKRSGENLH